jgi:pilus assembly protein FimV
VLALALLCFGLNAASVSAASLDKLDLKSNLYEPFEAHIALRGVSEDELDTLRVSRADEAVFERLGLVRSFALSTLKFKVVATAAQRGYVQVTSHERIREPPLSFVVEASFGGAVGSILQRRYDVLLNLK